MGRSLAARGGSDAESCYVPAVKRKLAIGAVAIAIIGLVALNLSLRTDPEPEYETDNAALPERPYSEVLRGEPAPEDEDEPEAESAPVAEGDPADPGDEETDEEVDGCDHPLIPSRSGQWRLYRWQISTEEHVAEMRVRATRTRALVSGEREVVWVVRATEAGENERLAQMTLSTRCRPGDDSEDPWFGILERAIGHRLTRRTARWRWPATLAAGTSFRGTATLDPSEADAVPPEGVEGPHMLTVTRNHIVDEQVEVEVPAGTFNAWRIAYEERQAYGTHGETGTGTLWVAPDVGLVRSRAENSRGAIQTIELVSIGGD